MRKLVLVFLMMFMLVMQSSNFHVSAEGSQDSNQDKTEATIEINNDPLMKTPSFTGTNYPISAFSWDSTGFLARYDFILTIANCFIMFSASLINISIFVLTLGYDPSTWLQPLQVIATAIEENAFQNKIWPIFAIVAGTVLLKDFAKRDIPRALKRGSFLLVAILCLVFFKSFGTAAYLEKITHVTGIFSFATTNWTMNPSDDTNKTTSEEINKNNETVFSELWTKLVEGPWQAGEFGETGMKVKSDEEVNKIQMAISNSGISGSVLSWFGIPQDSAAWVKKGMLWKDVFLRFPAEHKARNGLAEIINSDDYPHSQAAFNSYTRLMIGSFAMISNLFTALFFFFIGALLLIAHLIFLAAVVSGIFIIPISLMPWAYSEALLKWFVKALVGSLIIKVVLGAYFGFTLFFAKLISSAVKNLWNSFAVDLFIYPAVFVLSIILLWYIYRKWNSRQAVASGQNSGHESGKRRRRETDGEENEEGSTGKKKSVKAKRQTKANLAPLPPPAPTSGSSLPSALPNPQPVVAANQASPASTTRPATESSAAAPDSAEPPATPSSDGPPTTPDSAEPPAASSSAAATNSAEPSTTAATADPPAVPPSPVPPVRPSAVPPVEPITDAASDAPVVPKGSQHAENDSTHTAAPAPGSSAAGDFADLPGSQTSSSSTPAATKIADTEKANDDVLAIPNWLREEREHKLSPQPNAAEPNISNSDKVQTRTSGPSVPMLKLPQKEEPQSKNKISEGEKVPTLSIPNRKSAIPTDQGSSDISKVVNTRQPAEALTTPEPELQNLEPNPPAKNRRRPAEKKTSEKEPAPNIAGSKKKNPVKAKLTETEAAPKQQVAKSSNPPVIKLPEKSESN
ncbi:MFS transporter [Paenibacillus sp. HGH0039]|uniref:MFS transporter n=2 Tax=unclassified Paenibacillus TaxID=185978 RepID=UPI0005697E87|nr:MFS transporter [Paenibacillus sp. HGH0039]